MAPAKTSTATGTWTMFLNPMSACMGAKSVQGTTETVFEVEAVKFGQEHYVHANPSAGVKVDPRRPDDGVAAPPVESEKVEHDGGDLESSPSGSSVLSSGSSTAEVSYFADATSKRGRRRPQPAPLK
mmetsp:Transcript_36519/g.66937  ORF Transcript_36519/g.66937 Transcript_36519/m.66937 type:complete len:127 (+) Transcript_36519:84-464(+)